MGDLVVLASNLTEERALALCREDPDSAAKLLVAIASKNTDLLPGTAFVRREDGTILKKMRTSVRLAESDGTLVAVGKKKVGDEFVPAWDISISGYRKLNELPAIQVVKPEVVIVNGQKQMNPFIEVDKESGLPTVVYARCLAVGYSPMGSLIATDIMVRLDINIYLLENIQAKMDRERTDAARDDIAMYGAKDEPPLDAAGKKLIGYRFFPIHTVGGVGLWVNLRSRRTQNIFKDHTSRLKFIERLAQSFAERNALKAHPSMPKGVQAKNGQATIRVTGWTTDFDREDLNRLRELVESDRLPEFKDGKGQTIDVEAREVTGMDDGDRVALDAEAAEEQRQTRKEVGEEEEEADIGLASLDEDVLTEASAAYGRLVEATSRKKAAEILGSCGMKNLEEATAEQLRAFIGKVSEFENG